MEAKIVYFSRSVKTNTDETLRLAAHRAEELGIKTILIASTKGDTAARATRICKGCRVIAVGQCAGFAEPNVQRFTAENRKLVEEAGGSVLIGTHFFAGLSRAIRLKFNTYMINELVANVLRIFGEGMKVVCEISVMAADAGLVRTDEDIIAIAGTGRGADTAVILRPVNSNDFFSLKIKEILCMPNF